MKKVKILSLCVSIAFIVSVMAGCGGGTGEGGTVTPTKAASDATTDTKSGEKVKITVMNSKGEIQAPMEDVVKEFTKENPNITVEVVPCPAGTSPFEKISALYSSNNAPSISIVDGGDLSKLKDKAVDLSKETWVSDTPYAEECKQDGKVVAFPVTVEGLGLIYNKKVLDAAGVDPNSIKTQANLEEALKKVKASGKEGCIVGGMDWSLGNHVSVIPYANKSKVTADVKKYIDTLKAADLSTDKDWNGFVKTFDLLKTYNKAKADPNAIDSVKFAESLAKGDVGFGVQGSWAWPEMAKFQADPNNFGIIALPISDDAADIANTAIQAGPTKFAVVDKEQNDAGKQEASKKFLNWLATNKAGQEAIVTKAGCVMAFKSVAIQPADPLAKSVAAAVKSGSTLVFVGNLMPSDHWKTVGAFWQKYLADKEDKAALAKDIAGYWKTAK